MGIHADYYEILQVSPNADVDIIEAAHRRLAFKWHPDRRPGDPSANETMQLLNEACEVLSNPQKRLAYDQQRKQPSAQQGAQQPNQHKASERGAGQSQARGKGAGRQGKRKPEPRQEDGRSSVTPESGRGRLVALSFTLSLLCAFLCAFQGRLVGEKSVGKILVLAMSVCAIAWPIAYGLVTALFDRNRCDEPEQPAGNDNGQDDDERRGAAPNEQKEQQRLRRDAEQAAERKKEEERRRVEAERIEGEQERVRRDAQTEADRRRSQEWQGRWETPDGQQKLHAEKTKFGKAPDRDREGFQEPQSHAAGPQDDEKTEPDDGESESDTPLLPEIQSLLDRAEKNGYLTFDEVADKTGVFLLRRSPCGPIEVFPDLPDDRQKLGNLLTILTGAGIRLLEEADFSFGYVPPRPWFDAQNGDDEADNDDNESESAAWQENAIRAIEGD